jgi:hypothetical protein
MPFLAHLPHRRRAEGTTRRAARRAQKRHLANRVIRRMWNDETDDTNSTHNPPVTRERRTRVGRRQRADGAARA